MKQEIKLLYAPFISSIREMINKSCAKYKDKIVLNELASFKQIKKFYLREKEFEKTTTQKIKRHLIQINKP